MPAAAVRADGAPASAGVDQLDALTSLRFLAALYVLAFHYASLFPQSLSHDYGLGLGYSGVTFFFVLSGFILAHNYGRQAGGAGIDLRAYAIARVARIFPVLLLSLAVALPVLALDLALTADASFRAVKLSSIVLAPLGLQAWAPGSASTFNGPSWSVSAELFFYLVLPFVLGPILRRPLAWCAGVLALWAALAVTAWQLWLQLGDGSSVIFGHATLRLAVIEQTLKYLPPVRLPEFLLGIIVYALWAGRRDSLRGPRMLVALVLALAAMPALAVTAPEIVLHNGLTALVWAPLIVWAAGTRGGLLHHPFAVYLGRISYSLYLLHLPLGALVICCDQLLLGGALSQLPHARCAIAVALSLSAASVVYARIEEPWRRAITTRLREGQPAQQPHAVARA